MFWPKMAVLDPRKIRYKDGHPEGHANRSEWCGAFSAANKNGGTHKSKKLDSTDIKRRTPSWKRRLPWQRELTLFLFWQKDSRGIFFYINIYWRERAQRRRRAEGDAVLYKRRRESSGRRGEPTEFLLAPSTNCARVAVYIVVTWVPVLLERINDCIFDFHP